MRDSWWIATSLSNLAVVSHVRGDSERATELYEQSMDLFREQGDKHNLAVYLNNEAMVVCSQGDLERAAQLTEEDVALLRELGAKGDVALGLYNLGWIVLFQDDLGRAADLYRESLFLSWDAGLNPTVQMALEGFACVARIKGEAPGGEDREPCKMPDRDTKCCLMQRSREWATGRGSRRRTAGTPASTRARIVSFGS
jgi:tetratricopeptide (TPR) repeat protein